MSHDIVTACIITIFRTIFDL